MYITKFLKGLFPEKPQTTAPIQNMVFEIIVKMKEHTS